MIEIYCDGGCIVGSNIGAASYLIVKDGKFNFIHGALLRREGITNNQAEYAAVFLGLTDSHSWGEIKVYSDSEIVIKQLNNEYKINDNKLQRYYDAIYSVIEVEKLKLTFNNVGRTNPYIKMCDKLNKQIMAG